MNVWIEMLDLFSGADVVLLAAIFFLFEIFRPRERD
jgi:hypothetical protein